MNPELTAAAEQAAYERGRREAEARLNEVARRALMAASAEAYMVCASTSHVSLGDKVSDAILSLPTIHIIDE